MTGETIRWSVLAVVIVATSGFVYVEYQNTRPCVHPILFGVGVLDSRFGVDQSTLIRDAKKAVGIWNKAAGRSLLLYDPQGDLKLNLVYDSREETAKLGLAIATAQAREDAEHASIEALRAQFSAAQDSYNAEVEAVNTRGGATRTEAAKLEAERASLDSLAATINTNVAIYNQAVTATNQEVEQYDASAGKTFEEGEYVQDGSGRRINIFEFVGDTQLERVLAHEFGHAIGLGHDSKPQSIMYAKNESGNLVPTTSDLAALKALCGLN